MTEHSPTPVDAPLRHTAVPERHRRPGGRRPPLLAVALALAVAAALAFGIWRSGSKTPEPRAAAVPGVDLTEQRPGRVALDAVPWAEILSLEGPESDEPPLVPPSRFTPVLLELPPGEYRIVLRFPATGEEESRSFLVASGEQLTERITFENLDGKRYFEKVGW